MNYTLLTVRANKNSLYARDAAESINTWAMGAGYAGGFDKREIEASLQQLEREISECDPEIAQMLIIEEEIIEIDE